MIVGIGVDMVEIQRIKKACEKEAFLLRCFTSEENLLIAGSAAKAAGNFAVKEAVAKAFGTGFRNIKPAEIEVLRNPLGKPIVVLHGGAKALACRLGIEYWHISLTDTEELAQAFVIAENGKEQKR